MSKQPKGEQRPLFDSHPEDNEEMILVVLGYTLFIFAVGVIVGYAFKGIMG